MFMNAALELARKAADNGDVPVGAVVVKNGEIIGGGYNRSQQGDATAHAEVEAIREACSKLGDWRLDGCELFVTLEPCAMCAGAIINSRVSRVVFGADEPNTGCCGSVCNLFAMPFPNPPTLRRGLLAEKSTALLKQFFSASRK